jgi:hypothetical protein
MSDRCRPARCRPSGCQGRRRVTRRRRAGADGPGRPDGGRWGGRRGAGEEAAGAARPCARRRGYSAPRGGGPATRPVATTTAATGVPGRERETGTAKSVDRRPARLSRDEPGRDGQVHGGGTAAHAVPPRAPTDTSAGATARSEGPREARGRRAVSTRGRSASASSGVRMTPGLARDGLKPPRPGRRPGCDSQRPRPRPGHGRHDARRRAGRARGARRRQHSVGRGGTRSTLRPDR